MSRATEIAKKQLKVWKATHLFTEYGPVTGGLITAMIYNPSVWAWLCFILAIVMLIGGFIALFKHTGKTLIWGIILVLVFAINGVIMYIVISTCFIFAASNDLLFCPKYKKAKERYEQFKNQDAYISMNEVNNGIKQ